MPELRIHQVATVAFGRVQARADEDKSWQKKYGAVAHKLPGMILQNGLAQATGFLLAKGEPEHRAVLDDLTQVMRAAGVTTAVDRDALHQQIIGADLQQTLRLTRQALEASSWLKRYVQGLLRITATGDLGDESQNSTQQ